MVAFVRERAAAMRCEKRSGKEVDPPEVLDPDALTIGFPAFRH